MVFQMKNELNLFLLEYFRANVPWFFKSFSTNWKEKNFELSSLSQMFIDNFCILIVELKNSDNIQKNIHKQISDPFAIKAQLWLHFF